VTSPLTCLDGCLTCSAITKQASCRPTGNCDSDTGAMTSALGFKAYLVHASELGKHYVHTDQVDLCRDRVVAGEAGGPWATIAVLTEKSRPKQSSTGQAFSMWKVSDLAGDPAVQSLECHQYQHMQLPRNVRCHVAWQCASTRHTATLLASCLLTNCRRVLSRISARFQSGALGENAVD